MKKNIFIKTRLIVVFTIIITFFSPSVSLKAQDDYELKEVVVLSRHNIRAPLSTKGSLLDSATPHEWIQWSSDASELSLRGGILETAMGQYFRKWLISEGLFSENYHPAEDEVLFYANSKQRTIATAQYFASGFLPVANSEIDYRVEYDKMDPTFNPVFTFVSDEYGKDVISDMNSMVPDLSKEYELLMEVLDFKDSDAYKNGEITEFRNGDNEFFVEDGKEPSCKGSLRNATSLADALVLQYYESSDDLAAGFGHELTQQDWISISRIKDVYGDILFTSPLVAANVAHPLLVEINKDLHNDNRLFTFLCGHDSNIGSVLAALGVEDYVLDKAIEAKTPIGSKLVFEKWERNNEQFIKVELIYNSYEQLKNIQIIDLNNPPMSCKLKFKGLSANEDGMYKLDDFYKHLSDCINQYDVLLDNYAIRLPKTGID